MKQASHDVAQVVVLKAWSIHGREALNASLKVQAGDQSTTFSRFMPMAMWESAAIRDRDSKRSGPVQNAARAAF